ncbi:uncharacterized protein NDAI_0G03680 [Naumovozyma dairenensis CBS 421]|uniref:Uncharacterized protein n=1 Tax=Naumovozyma dairenensis (strain ATCC 10597 / BCRC 20456 / CBS 421 / NBRC 0211 / NRRL Y-12639) TaxID=1071378 RepID=G0WED4_NAUDC|nr:hypothetical protein NDAI_0G03680 [Naumovozyma dairenensis CBS 421]CCD26145.2 hypothetical protein NDAI_0G03680 [Naumovozyma dairenensis CBS 421]
MLSEGPQLKMLTLQDLPVHIIQKVFVLSGNGTAMPILNKTFYNCLRPTDALVNTFFWENFTYDLSRAPLLEEHEKTHMPLAHIETLFDYPMFRNYITVHYDSVFDQNDIFFINERQYKMITENVDDRWLKTLEHVRNEISKGGNDNDWWYNILYGLDFYDSSWLPLTVRKNMELLFVSDAYADTIFQIFNYDGESGYRFVPFIVEWFVNADHTFTMNDLFAMIDFAQYAALDSFMHGELDETLEYIMTGYNMRHFVKNFKESNDNEYESYDDYRVSFMKSLLAHYCCIPETGPMHSYACEDECPVLYSLIYADNDTTSFLKQLYLEFAKRELWIPALQVRFSRDEHHLGSDSPGCYNGKHYKMMS